MKTILLTEMLSTRRLSEADHNNDELENCFLVDIFTHHHERNEKSTTNHCLSAT